MSNEQNASKDPEDKENSEELDTELSEETDDDGVDVSTESADSKLSAEENTEVSEEVDTSDSEQAVEDAVLVVEDDAAEDEKASEDGVDGEEPSVPGTITNIETTTAPPPPTPAPATPSSSSTFGVVFGGLIAGAIGFLVATFAVPEGWPNPPSDPNDALQAALDAETARVDQLEQRISELLAAAPSGEVDLSPLTSQIETLSERIEALAGEVGSNASRVAVLEERPAQAAIEAPEINFDAEMDEIRAELAAAAAAARAEVDAAQARAAEVEAEAARAAEAALQRAALAEITAALESGSPFAEPLSRIANAPSELLTVAEVGVPTLTALREGFPEAARAALSEAQSVPTDAPATQRLAAFIRKQTNARSLSPREGDDADAVLSRAEAALNGGDLSSALAELAALPDGAVGAMSDWLSQAEVRATAVEAAGSLAEELN